jgi:hypothetical protein
VEPSKKSAHSLPRVHARQFFESGIQREQFFAASSERLARVVESHVNARATAPLAGLSATGGADQHVTHGASGDALEMQL